MYMICNQGFVTIGFWYPKAKEWHDSGQVGGYNITSQVTHWAKMPTAPVAVSGKREQGCEKDGKNWPPDYLRNNSGSQS
jgi:hypothetical protein